MTDPDDQPPIPPEGVTFRMQVPRGSTKDHLEALIEVAAAAATKAVHDYLEGIGYEEPPEEPA